MRNFLSFIVLAFLFISCETTTVGPASSSSSNITYSVSKSSHVRVIVDNSYNTTVKVIVDAEQNPGNYSYNFTLTGLPEGIYFIVFSFDGEIASRRKLFLANP